jgi:hypothetical protein
MDSERIEARLFERHGQDAFGQGLDLISEPDAPARLTRFLRQPCHLPFPD